MMNRRSFLQQTAMATVLLALPWERGIAKPQQAHWRIAPNFSRADFGTDFLWGVATAAYQIEGAHDVEGKSPSIWDRFTAKKGKIARNENGNIACDFYHRYPEDIALVRELNFDVFRFSTAWTRILPNGTGKPNSAGIDFYHRVIDRCLEKGIAPWLTLYHWDLPQMLEDKGGWANRDVVNWFAEYADVCSRAYGDKVSQFMILNEPAASSALGYMVGIHAPGRRNVKKFFAAIHHTALCQAEGARVVKNNAPRAQVGTTFSCAAVDAWHDQPKHQKAARRMDALLNRLFIEPALGMGYPYDGWNGLKRLEKHMREGDEARLQFNFDFIGLQNYTRNVTKFNLFPPMLWAKEVKPTKRGISPEQITDMNWEVYPQGIYRILKRFAAYPNVKNIVITENGCAFPDEVRLGENGEKVVHDEQRLKFFHDYLAEVLRAKREGVPVNGYFVWSLMDNFEWHEGYRPRFGVVYVDFESQSRIVKDSGRWFQHFLAK